MSRQEHNSDDQDSGPLEFLAGPSGPILPAPGKSVSDQHLEQSQAATDLFRANADRIKHFMQRAEELGRSGQDTIITLINVDDPNGSILADLLMPGHDWQRYRDAGEIPIARGLAVKDGVRMFLFDHSKL